MPYSDNIKWIGINKQQYPIKIIECGVERIIPATNYKIPPQKQMVKLHSSCYEEYKELFHVVKKPNEITEWSKKKDEYKKKREEKKKEKPLLGVYIDSDKREKLMKELSIVDDDIKCKRVKKGLPGKKGKYQWEFLKVDTNETFIVEKNVIKFCKEHNITPMNPIYIHANKDTIYKGYKITKKLKGEKNV